MTCQFVVLYVALFLGHAAFVGVATASAAAFHVRVKAVKLGVIPVFRRGRFTLGLVPLTAIVGMFDSRYDAGAATDPGAFDHQPRLVRALLACSGVLTR